jgi:hypothetical protein
MSFMGNCDLTRSVSFAPDMAVLIDLERKLKNEEKEKAALI